MKTDISLKLLSLLAKLRSMICEESQKIVVVVVFYFAIGSQKSLVINFP